MRPTFRIAPITPHYPDIDDLYAESISEGHRFVQTLGDEWASGKNRFDRRGELFAAALNDDRIEGFCGLNRDPYDNKDEVARLGRGYIRRDVRGTGLGSALLQTMFDAAEGMFSVIRLRTDTKEGAAFYARHGFEAVENATATHIKVLRRIALHSQ